MKLEDENFCGKKGEKKIWKKRKKGWGEERKKKGGKWEKRKGKGCFFGGVMNR